MNTKDIQKAILDLYQSKAQDDMNLLIVYCRKYIALEKSILEKLALNFDIDFTKAKKVLHDELYHNPKLEVIVKEYSKKELKDMVTLEEILNSDLIKEA